MIELYHGGDAICAHKVRVALAEKELEWTSHIVRDPRAAEYLELNPGGYVPTLVHNGHVLTESRIISEYLEDAFPSPRLMPATALERHRARLWSKQIDDSLHLGIFVLSFVALGGWGLGQASEEDRQRRLSKDPIKREITLELLENGINSRWVPLAVQRFQKLLNDMEHTLKGHPWLAGDIYSLADADMTAYVHRLNQMRLDVLWAGLPALVDWFQRVRSRPSYEVGILQWITGPEKERYTINSSGVRAAAVHLINENDAKDKNAGEKRH
jgi:glutathione S-transferase